ncbi:MAG: RtcB family protein [bacterium]|nr:RtcB family protein [bacterium]
MERDWRVILERVDDYRWKIPMSFMKGMKVPGLIYADERLLGHIREENTPIQVANVSTLPGIVKYSLAMPDIHWGYGLPIGGVAATDIEKGGIVSPGGVGSDINCGVRLVRTDLRMSDIKDKLERLTAGLFRNIPCGLGSEGKIVLSPQDEREVLRNGCKWAVKKGYGKEEDILHTEEGGSLPGADPDKVSQRAFERGRKQLGTLGSGNHFLEIQEVEEIYDEKAASVFGLFKGQITVMIHSGSRGLGYQVCEDYVRIMSGVYSRYGITLVDRQLACAPFHSKEGRDYFSAMAAAANYAWANRQCIMHWTRETFEEILGMNSKELGMKLVYDVAHNIGKLEEHVVEGKVIKLCVHRKGATRAFPANHPDVPVDYKEVGQPVIVPGDMGTASYVLVGTDLGMEETFGSTCHGAGRVMSRAKAKEVARGRNLIHELKEKGLIVKAKGRDTIAEEMPEAYKDVSQVVHVLHEAGISKKVAKMHPLAVVKG